MLCIIILITGKIAIMITMVMMVMMMMNRWAVIKWVARASFELGATPMMEVKEQNYYC